MSLLSLIQDQNQVAYAEKIWDGFSSQNMILWIGLGFHDLKERANGLQPNNQPISSSILSAAILLLLWWFSWMMFFYFQSWTVYALMPGSHNHAKLACPCQLRANYLPSWTPYTPKLNLDNATLDNQIKHKNSLCHLVFTCSCLKRDNNPWCNLPMSPFRTPPILYCSHYFQ